MMICSNCDKEINTNKIFFRAGKNGSLFCSKECSYEAYEGYYSKMEVDKTIEMFIK